MISRKEIFNCTAHLSWYSEDYWCLQDCLFQRTTHEGLVVEQSKLHVNPSSSSVFYQSLTGSQICRMGTTLNTCVGLVEEQFCCSIWCARKKKKAGTCSRLWWTLGPLQMMTWCRGEEWENKYLSDVQFISQRLKQIISGEISHVALILEEW